MMVRAMPVSSSRVTVLARALALSIRITSLLYAGRPMRAARGRMM